MMDAKRFKDRSYPAPAPWTRWDPFACCWTCSMCGESAGRRIHGLGCPNDPPRAHGGAGIDMELL